MKSNEDVLKQILNKISSIESRLQELESPTVNNQVTVGYGSTSAYPNDYCHKEFMKKMYPFNPTIVSSCECEKCTGHIIKFSDKDKALIVGQLPKER